MWASLAEQLGCRAGQQGQVRGGQRGRGVQYCRTAAVPESVTETAALAALKQLFFCLHALPVCHMGWSCLLCVQLCRAVLAESAYEHAIARDSNSSSTDLDQPGSQACLLRLAAS